MLPCGEYRTTAGSVVTVTGAHCGIVRIEFDWLEEGGCIDCEPEPYPVDGDLLWHCNECGIGQHAKLFPVMRDQKVAEAASIKLAPEIATITTHSESDQL